MRKGKYLLFLMLLSKVLFAQNEIGPEGHKMLWVLLIILVIAGSFILLRKRFYKSNTRPDNAKRGRRRVHIQLEKDTLYYPDNLQLTVKNTGTADIDLDRPLLIFDNFWLKRKFRLKGFANRNFYPLYLEQGKTHTLQIDLPRFYKHDKKLRKYPKAKVILNDVKGKRLGSRSVFMRKTLFKF